MSEHCGCFFFELKFFIEPIVDSHTVVRHNTESSFVYFVWVQLLFFASTFIYRLGRAIDKLVRNVK